MKKILALVISALMILALVACGNTPAETTPAETTPEVTEPEVTEPEVSENVIVPEIEDGTWGAAFWTEFQAAVAVEGATTESIVTALYASEAGQAVNNAMVSPVMEGYLPGFSADITGFKSGATLASMMMGVPFAAYVFELEADANVRQFVKLLKDNSDPAWNICTTAEQTTIGAVDNFVILVHSDLQMPSIGGGAAEIVAPDFQDGSNVQILWDDFVLYMDNAGSFSLATDVADYLAMNEVLGAEVATEALGETVEAAGLKYAIEGHNNAAVVKAGEVAIYVIQIDPGMEAWADYYVGGNIAEDANIVWGAYGTTFVLMVNVEA